MKTLYNILYPSIILLFVIVTLISKDTISLIILLSAILGYIFKLIYPIKIKRDLIEALFLIFAAIFYILSLNISKDLSLGSILFVTLFLLLKLNFIYNLFKKEKKFYWDVIAIALGAIGTIFIFIGEFFQKEPFIEMGYLTFIYLSFLFLITTILAKEISLKENLIFILLLLFVILKNIYPKIAFLAEIAIALYLIKKLFNSSFTKSKKIFYLLPLIFLIDGIYLFLKQFNIISF